MVLALKYRPKKFSEVVGQEAVIQTLKNALDNKKLANAYLFSGLRGSGKTSTARIFAKALQCEKGESSEPCEVCENCIMANENRHMDIIEMDAASNRKIEDIKDIIEQTRYKPTFGRYKIFIIKNWIVE
jgi:DNA polymerase-3 subunit gamma/tau